MGLSYNPLDLEGKRILVTGASSGIGRATAIAISRLNGLLVLSGRRRPALEETLGSLVGQGKHTIAELDLGAEPDLSVWMKNLVARIGVPLDGLVHAAGVSQVLPIRSTGRKQIDAILGPNLIASMLLLRAYAAKGVSASSGSVVMVSSVAAITSSPGLMAYGASKSALHALVRTGALELRDKNIRINAVVPGYVDTPMTKKARSELPDGGSMVDQRQFLGIVTPEEIGVAIAYLLSPAARHITGAELLIDGGYSC